MKFIKIILTALLGFVILFALLYWTAIFIGKKSDLQTDQPKSKLLKKVEQFVDFSESVKDYTVTKTLNFVGVYSIASSTDAKNMPPEQYLTIMQNAEKMADFSEINKDYIITKTINISSMNAVFAEYQKTGQYMAIVNPGELINISKKDLHSGRLKQFVIDNAAKLATPDLKLKQLDVIPMGKLYACNQSVPYASVKIKIFRNGTETAYQGMVGIITDPKTNKNELIVSGHRKGHYEQKIAENFFKDVKLQ